MWVKCFEETAWDVGFWVSVRDSDLGSRVQGSGFRLRVSDESLKSWVSGCGFRDSG